MSKWNGVLQQLVEVTNEDELKFIQKKVLSTHGVRQVFAPGGDWTVVYVNGNKVWEGHDCNSGAMQDIMRALGATYKMYEYTDEDEIDGCTPDRFCDIIGIKEL